MLVTSIFSFFRQCFQKASFSTLLKVVIVCYKVKYWARMKLYFWQGHPLPSTTKVYNNTEGRSVAYIFVGEDIPLFIRQTILGLLLLKIFAKQITLGLCGATFIWWCSNDCHNVRNRENADLWDFLLFPNPSVLLCLTLSQTIPGFYMSEVQVFWKHWEKEKLLITSNFSFSHGVFYPVGELSAIFIKSEIVVCQFFEFRRV